MDEVTEMGAHCARCDIELSGNKQAVDTVDHGVLCRECADEVDAKPLPDVTEPGTWEVNDYLGEPPSAQGPAGAIQRMSREGWIVFAVGLVVTAPLSVWLAWPKRGGFAELWEQSGYSLIGGLLVGTVIWFSLCIVMFLE